MENAGWATLPRGVLRMEGPDVPKWLHKIVTADVQHLQSGQGAESALLDAKGHFVAEFLLLRDGAVYGALSDPAAHAALAPALKRYIIRDKVTLKDVTDGWTCVTLVGPSAAVRIEQVLGTPVPQAPHNWVWGHLGTNAARVIKSVRARVPAYDVMMPVAGVPELYAALHGLPEIPKDVLETLRIEMGLPRWGVDFDESTLALEIPDVMQIRVDQGCYVGQEVVARIVHRGHVNRHLRGLILETGTMPAPGDMIQYEGKEVGTVTSATRSPLLGMIALGYVRREVEPGASVELNGAPARVVELPFPLDR